MVGGNELGVLLEDSKRKVKRRSALKKEIVSL